MYNFVLCYEVEKEKAPVIKEEKLKEEPVCVVQEKTDATPVTRWVCSVGHCNEQCFHELSCVCVALPRTLLDLATRGRSALFPIQSLALTVTYFLTWNRTVWSTANWSSWRIQTLMVCKKRSCCISCNSLFATDGESEEEPVTKCRTTRQALPCSTQCTDSWVTSFLPCCSNGQAKKVKQAKGLLPGIALYCHLSASLWLGVKGEATVLGGTKKRKRVQELSSDEEKPAGVCTIIPS